MSYSGYRWIRSCITFIYKIFKRRRKEDDKAPLQNERQETTKEDTNVSPGINSKPFKITLSNNWYMEKLPVEKENIYSAEFLEAYAKHTLNDVNKVKHILTFKDDKNRPYNLNIWGIRSNNQHAGFFDDTLVIWSDTYYNKFSVTVDPSDLYLLNPIHKKGTAIIKPGQYRGLWEKGFHQGREDHPALVQVRPIKVYRDFNKDSILDWDKPKYEHSIIKPGKHGHVQDFLNEQGDVIFTIHTGLFGINCHRASKWKIKERVGLYSAGCVVHNNPFRYKDEFLPVIDKAINNWGNYFTFTLVTEEQLNKFLNEKYSK